LKQVTRKFKAERPIYSLAAFTNVANEHETLLHYTCWLHGTAVERWANFPCAALDEQLMGEHLYG